MRITDARSDDFRRTEIFHFSTFQQSFCQITNSKVRLGMAGRRTQRSNGH